MASFSVEEFLGDGVLKEIVQKLANDGWDDVPTLKMMQVQDMEAIDLTDTQRDALELRIYLHDRSLMEYADRIEASGKNLPELLSSSSGNVPAELMLQQFGMKKADVARFTDRSLACGIKIPPPTYADLKAGKTLVSTTTTTTIPASPNDDNSSITSAVSAAACKSISTPRRCVMCRGEAHQLYARKHILDAYGSAAGSCFE